MAGPTRSSLSPTYTVQGTLLSVNTKTFLAQVALDSMRSVATDVQVAATYCHPFGGEGGYVLPEAGATCYVTFPSDGSRPFLSSFIMPPTDVDGDAGGREELTPGGFVFTTRDGNFFRLLRGGVVQIGATSLAQRIYIPVLNTIRDLFETHESISPAGKMVWSVDESLVSDSKTRFLLHLNESVEDATPRLIVEVGEFTDQPDVLVPVVSDTGTLPTAVSYLRVLILGASQEEKFSLRVSKDGKIQLTAADYFFAKIDGEVRLEFAKTLDLIGPAGYKHSVSLLGGLTERMTSWDVEAVSAILLRAASFGLEASVVNLGIGASQSTLRGEVYLAWLRGFAGAVASLLPAPLKPLAVVPPDAALLSLGVKVP